jgi:hypothetical protein
MDDTIALTLKFMANSIYQEIMVKTPQVKPPSIADYKFYKKRVFNMTKEMLKGEYPNDYIKDAHMHYVDVLIEYMKDQDRTDILQKDYEKCDILDKDVLLNDKPFDISESSKVIMKDVEHNRGPLDGFVVTKKVIIKEQPSMPLIRDVNIKTDEHKIKGIKLKHSISAD